MKNCIIVTQVTAALFIIAKLKKHNYITTEH